MDNTQTTSARIKRSLTEHERGWTSELIEEECEERSNREEPERGGGREERQ